MGFTFCSSTFLFIPIASPPSLKQSLNKTEPVQLHRGIPSFTQPCAEYFTLLAASTTSFVGLQIQFTHHNGFAATTSAAGNGIMAIWIGYWGKCHL